MTRLTLVAAAALLGAAPVSAKTFYFPHYGDGGGLSMLFSVSNLASSTATGNIRFFNSQGQTQSLPLAGGPASSVPISLTPNSTLLLRTDGSSSPVISGYVEVEVDQDEASGVAIFQFASGLETSVLPLQPGRRFSVFVERSDNLDTGLAAFRPTGEPISLELYDLQGNLLAESEWSFEGSHTAMFLSQVLSGVGNTQGVLTLSSREVFAPVGLRFGGGVLSTVPVVELPELLGSFNLFGLDLGPYVGGPDPTRGATVSEARLRELTAVLQPHAQWIRTYGSGAGLQRAGTVAHELNLKAALGAWLDGNLATNNTEINALIANGQAGNLDMAVVGSETLLRGNLTEEQLIGYIQQVKQALPGIPVTTADTFNELLNHPNVVAAVDVVFVNYYPFFDSVPLNSAISVIDDWHRQLQAIAQEKQIIVSETGWPSCGQSRGAAQPSPENAAAYLRDFLLWARDNQVDYFYFEAFDERWKAQFEGELGACWGLWDENLNLKPDVAEIFR